MNYTSKIFFLFIVTTLVFESTIFSQTPNWYWAESAGGSGDDYANSVAIDALGNTYVVGYFISSSIAFGSTTLTNTGSADIFIAKYNPNGDILWAKNAVGTDDDEAYSVAVDEIGNIFITGYFVSPTLNFGSIILTKSGGSNDIFLAKYDTNGNVIWAKSANGSFSDWASSVNVDLQGNAYLTGYFQGTTLNFGSTILVNSDTSGNYVDIFLAKYNSNGDVLWAKSAGGIDEDEGISVAVDASGNSYVTGDFQSSTIIFGSDTLTNMGIVSDIFIAKYNTNGNILWAKSVNGTKADFPKSVAVDIYGNSYLAIYSESPYLTFGQDTLSISSSRNSILTKYDSSGNLLWAKNAEGAQVDVATSVAIDTLGNSYITGYFYSSTLSFGSTVLTKMDSTSVTPDIFVAKYNPFGNVQWAKNAGGCNYDKAYSIDIDAIGNSYVAGVFYSSSCPIFSIGSTILTNVGGKDIFLTKLSNSSGIGELNDSLSISVFPNPITDRLTIIIPTKATIEILNINGQIIKSISSVDKKTTIDLESLSGGVYIIKAKTDAGIITKKFVKQ